MTTKIINWCWLAPLLMIISSFGPIKPEGVPFKTVTIGNAEWTAENLNVSRFRNGDLIFEANTYDEWEYASINGIPAWCYYNNNPEYGKKYGKLYNGWAINDSRGLGPEGWRVPNDKEWIALADELGGADTAGEKVRSSAGWGCSKNTSDDGFFALPGGYRTHEMPKYYGGPFYDAGKGGYWWTSTKYVVDNIWVRNISCEKASLGKASFDRTAGMSVRLIKDK